jgi:molecular chaperone DnaK (HSP70)
LGKAGVPLGGRDLDRWIAQALCPEQPLALEVLGAAEALKCALSERDEALHILSAPGGRRQNLSFTRARLEELLERQGLREVLTTLLEAMGSAARREGLDLARIDAVLPVGGSSRIPWVRRVLREALPTVPFRDERPVAAVAMGALALTPGVRIKDVLRQGVCLRVWDQRSRGHRWHPLFVAGQPWPTTQPLELRLACSGVKQTELELVLGEPDQEERLEVVFDRGVPVIHPRQAGSARVRQGEWAPIHLSLPTPVVVGVDRVCLRFSINARAELEMEGEDLLTGAPLPRKVFGMVR